MFLFYHKKSLNAFPNTYLQQFGKDGCVAANNALLSTGGEVRIMGLKLDIFLDTINITNPLGMSNSLL